MDLIPFSEFRVYPPNQLAEILGVSVDRVRYILNTHPHIKPAVTVDTKRFYRPDAVAMALRKLA